MSSTNRGKERHLDDHYATPPELSEFLCQTLKEDYGLLKPTSVLEPGCGAGSFLDAIEKTWPNSTRHGIDLNDDLLEIANKNHTVINMDYLEHGPLKHYSLIIGNPPFKYATEFIEKSVQRCSTLAFLLRLNFLGGQKRFDDLWSQFSPSHVYIMPARPGFTKDGRTDSIEYMFCIWDNKIKQPTISHIDNRGIESKWKTEKYIDKYWPDR